MTVLPAADDSHASHAEAAADQEAAAQQPPTEDGDTDVLAIAALVAGLLGLAAGVGALIQVRRRP